ncbi:MAG TPA: 2Fe-2S iron-sulfur cluster binding domain-containing protein [Kofleriaceae bacterium]|nr:2Fe-2S iron-sulfur cluster binding domain-containing protein [Kofleriaceae bacterium]
MPKVTFEREQLTVESKPGQTVLEVAEQAGIDVFRGIWPGLHCNRMKGWCNRCKVWVKSDTPGAMNPPTSKERSPLRINGAVRGTMRLACQVVPTGDVIVHTRAGGPATKTNATWEASDEPTKWKERWAKRNEAGAKDDADDAAVKEG